MWVFQVVGIGIIAAVFSVVLLQYKPEYALVLSLGAGVLIVAVSLFHILPAIEWIKELTKNLSLDSQAISILFKVLGVAVTAQIGADICRDHAQNSLASKVELAGKVCMIVLMLPLVKAFLDMVLGILKL